MMSRFRLLRHLARQSSTGGAYEPELTAWIERVVRQGWTCVDVGANEGQITEALVPLVGPSGRIVAFEAHPANVAVLRKRFRAAPAVEVVDAAVSDGSSERLKLYAGRNDYSAEWNVVGHDVDGRPTRSVLEVRAVALDVWFSQGEPLHFVKIDVEGAEGLVLTGMRRLLREQQPVVAVEFHDEDGWAGRRELLEAGYVLSRPDGSLVDPAGPRVYHVIAEPNLGRQG